MTWGPASVTADGPVSAVDGLGCECALPPPGVVEDTDLVEVLAGDGYRLWGWTASVHTLCDDEDDFRWWLLISPDGMGLWVAASEFEFDPFLSSRHPRLSRLFAALWDLTPWFALPEEAGVGAEAGVALATGWAPFGLSPMQAAAMERADRLPDLFGDWFDVGIQRRWTMDTLVQWACAFEEPSTAERWIDAGFLRFPWVAQAWECETTISTGAAFLLHGHGAGASETAAHHKEFEAALRVTVGASPDAWLTDEQREVCEDAVVLATLLPDLGNDDALLCSRAGLWDVDEVADLLDRGPLDRAALKTLAALQS